MPAHLTLACLQVAIVLITFEFHCHQKPVFTLETLIEQLFRPLQINFLFPVRPDPLNHFCMQAGVGPLPGIILL